ncbi:MAG: hypothetical protein ACRCX8_06135 [Sarcina sp.]
MNFEEYMNSQNADEWMNDCDCHCNNGCDDEDECLEDTVDTSCMSCCRPTYRPLPSMGRVEVFSLLNCSEGDPISGVPFNLYLIEKGCEKLVASKKTDCHGKVEFNCLENGLYRVQQIVDECVFECPEYYPGKEFCITEATKCQRIYVINKLRQLDRCLKRMIDRAAECAVKRVLSRYCRKGC